VLVFTADLEQVEEVCGGGVDGNEVFGGFGGRSREVEDFEVFGALEDFDKNVRGIWGEDGTLTYSLISMPFILTMRNSMRAICGR
jgi:hypothetical protein